MGFALDMAHHATLLDQRVHFLLCAALLLRRCPLVRLGFVLGKVNRSATRTFNAVAKPSSQATDGALTPRSRRLINSIEPPTALAS